MAEVNPLVTFGLISYNQEKFIVEAVQSALSQTYSPLEIVISDDCSSDHTYELIEKIASNYTGPHKLIISKNEVNLGLARNVNRVWELSTGDLVVFQAGDDISVPVRTEKIVAAWLSKEPRPDLIYSGEDRIDDEGKFLERTIRVVDSTPSIHGTLTGSKVFVAGGATAAYTRRLHLWFGPLNSEVYAEDFVYSFRALLGNGVLAIRDALIKYRIHNHSILGQWRSRVGQSRKNLLGYLALLHEHKKAIDIMQIVNPYLRWRLNRRIKTTQYELRVLDESGWRIRGFLWAAATCRPRLFIQIVRGLFDKSNL
jgi:glycosyltransferase involved in cell wall biosynthesis